MRNLNHKKWKKAKVDIYCTTVSIGGLFILKQKSQKKGKIDEMIM
jgi:hypothetical protein